ncbi:MAG TPA: 2,4-dihydroxyhept-2-ene-1,7-dioic acid aldolase [bacterium]|nr:2,4-dihydroxyhept-2-ene-1,7-dioic acid aldolase [bacterium]
MSLRGSIVPLVTPFRNGGVDDRAITDLIEWQIDNGSHGVSVTGSTGEPAALSIEEREGVIETAVRAARGRVPVVAGTGSAHLEETLRLTRFARRVGADAALIVTPYYTRPGQEGLYRFFRTVADAVDIPIILYNIPGRTAVNLEPETTARLARDCRNIIGVKESNKDLEHIARVMHRCGRQFLVYSGIELLCFPILALGGAGYVSATGNVMPREVARLYDLVAAGKWEEARDLHYHLLPMNDVLFIETNPVPAKTALGLMGRCSPEVRLPHTPLRPENEARLRDVMMTYDLLPAVEARQPTRSAGAPPAPR